MTSWREIERLRKDRAAFRALARGLLPLAEDTDNPWEAEFLRSISEWNGKELTTRQSEKLLEIRDGLQWLDKVGDGFSVRILLDRCHEARLDLSERDEQWIMERRESNPALICRRDTGRLLRCCRELNLVEPEPSD